MCVACCRWACAYDTDHWTNRNPDALIELDDSILNFKDATVIAVNMIYAFTQTDAHHAIFIWYDIENFDFQSVSGFCIFDIKWASDGIVATHVQKTEVLVININLTIIAVFGHERDGFPGFNC